ncbi:MAG: glycosyltransferase family 4 protein [Actinobacteria bacterium]|nr:glycosyltransferase family 4 protein [Actinomycetota bacterium]
MSSYYLPSESKIGAGYQAHGLAQAMSRAGHDVTMFSPCAKPDDAIYHHVKVKVDKPLATFRWAFALRRIDLSDFDVFHAAGDDYWMMGKARPPHVRTMHGSCFAEALHIHGAVGRVRMFMLGLAEVLATFVADRTVLVSANTKRWYPWVKTIIPNGVDTQLFRPADDDSRACDPTILFVGTYENRKRGKLLMEIFEREIRPSIPDAKLWMVCSDAPEAPGVEVLGRLNDDELADRYRRAWVFCLPSTYEGFGVPYIEAMASGTAVVATPNVGAREVLGDGKYGVICAADDLGPTLLRLLRDSDERVDIAARGLAQSRVYSWESVVASYEEIYTNLVATRRSSAPRTR